MHHEVTLTTMTAECDRLKAEVAELVKKLEALVYFCDEATVYEATHASEYSSYTEASALIRKYGGGA